MTQPILIAGPTASGKSSLALELAEQLGDCVIVNADSMQVYSGWSLLTARPSSYEEEQVPHRLYGHIDPAETYSVGAWLREIYGVLKEARETELRPIIVGGTGLYFTSLVRGLSMIPEIPDEVRERAEEKLSQLGRSAFHTELLRRDPKAEGVDPMNPRRLVRAWEVHAHTGKSLTEWAAQTPPPLLPLGQTKASIILEADPDWLRDRIEQRFDEMIDFGALDEATMMVERDIPEGTPSLKALGGPALMAHIRGMVPLEEAVEVGKADTRRYAKRQRTWFRNQMADWSRIPAGPEAFQKLTKLLDKLP